MGENANISYTKAGDTWIWRKNTECRLCGSGNMHKRVVFPSMSIATATFAFDEVGLSEDEYTAPVPMEFHACGDCGLMQIPFVCNPELQYRNYVYETTFSLGLPEHFVTTAQMMIDKISLEKGSRVVEFGSNDGTCLKAYKQLGMQVVGIDPAVNLAKKATEAGVQTYSEFFNIDLADKIAAEHGKADLLIANNVIANIDDLPGVFRAVEKILSDDGVFVFETQYGRDVFDHFLIDTIYNEHLTYFTITPLVRVLETFGLELFDVMHIASKGGSIRAFVQKKGGNRLTSSDVRNIHRAEEDDGIAEQPYFDDFSGKASAKRDAVHKILRDAKEQGIRIAGYGASVGTATLLGQFDLLDMIEFLVDDNENNPDTFVGPGCRFDVKPSQALQDEGIGMTVVFAWRYIDPIRKRNTGYQESGGKFLVLLPDPNIV